MSEKRVLTAEDHQQTIDVAVGATLLYWATHGTSAYQWREPKVAGDSVQFYGYESMPSRSTAADEPAIPGATSEQAFKFVAVAPGTSKIELSQGYMSRDESDLRLAVTVRVA